MNNYSNFNLETKNNDNYQNSFHELQRGLEFGQNNNSSNMQRINMERHGLFNINNKSSYNMYNSFNTYDKQKDNKMNHGEITGNSLDLMELDQGMPMRSNYLLKKKGVNNEEKNHYLDFDLYDKKADMNVAYNDTLNSIESKYFDLDYNKNFGQESFIRNDLDDIKLLNNKNKLGSDMKMSAL